MKTIDGHSASVARKHYILTCPENDAKLAKELVRAVLGETVPWPQLRELQDLDMVNSIAEPWHGDDELADDADDDVDLPWWELGEFFGVTKPLPILEDKPSDDASASGEAHSPPPHQHPPL